jgi:predicted fused transcriptional regulator/phosphomethylpyrimidine kinase
MIRGDGVSRTNSDDVASGRIRISDDQKEIVRAARTGDSQYVARPLDYRKLEPEADAQERDLLLPSIFDR